MTVSDWSTSDMPGQAGRVAIITGANSGLGLAAASALAGAGATTILACRSASNAERARAAIRAARANADVHVAVLDVASLASVRAFAEEISQRFAGIDLLINNAGIMATPREVSPEGFERQFATNHLGHFALVGLLLPSLQARPGSRVVAVSSIAARSGRIDFDDLMGERRYDPWKAYNQSKLADLMFALELQRRLQRAGATTSALAAHPGASITNLFATPGGFFVKRVVSPLMMRFMFQPAEQGALPILYAATARDVERGGYYGPRGYKEMKGPPAPAAIPPQALDEAVASRLWQESERLTSVRYSLRQ
jgi:NAD(P)-dependent dehydrogenase (short-subunit alcohol dehydrogenase family)